MTHTRILAALLALLAGTAALHAQHPHVGGHPGGFGGGHPAMPAGHPMPGPHPGPAGLPSYRPTVTPAPHATAAPPLRPTAPTLPKSNPGGTYRPTAPTGATGLAKAGPGSKLSAGKPGLPKTVSGGPPRPGSGPKAALRPATVKAPVGAGGSRVSTASYAATHGMKLKSGFYAYRGLGHRHWTRRCFSPRWGTWCWYDPCTSGWYYWCGDRGLYLPVRYLVVCQPTVMTQDATTDVPPDAEEVPTAGDDEVPDLPEPPQ